jgi:hypothetical protein
MREMCGWRCGSKKRERKKNDKIEIKTRWDQFCEEGRKIRGVSSYLLD